MSKRKVKVIPDGSRFRVVEHNGSPANGDRAPADGGGFDNERDALHLAAQINERRKAKP